MDTKVKLQTIGIVFLLLCVWSYFFGIGWIGIAFWAFVFICILSCDEKRASEEPVVIPEPYEISYTDLINRLYDELDELEKRLARMTEGDQVTIDALDAEERQIREEGQTVREKSQTIGEESIEDWRVRVDERIKSCCRRRGELMDRRLGRLSEITQIEDKMKEKEVMIADLKYQIDLEDDRNRDLAERAREEAEAIAKEERGRDFYRKQDEERARELDRRCAESRESMYPKHDGYILGSTPTQHGGGPAGGTGS